MSWDFEVSGSRPVSTPLRRVISALFQYYSHFASYDMADLLRLLLLAVMIHRARPGVRPLVTRNPALYLRPALLLQRLSTTNAVDPHPPPAHSYRLIKSATGLSCLDRLKRRRLLLIHGEMRPKPPPSHPFFSDTTVGHRLFTRIAYIVHGPWSGSRPSHRNTHIHRLSHSRGRA